MKFQGKVTVNLKDYIELGDQLKRAEHMRVEVGVLSNKTERGEGEEFDNAALGAVHELGSRSAGIPARSFLRVPIMTKMREKVAKVTAKRIVQNMLKRGAKNTMAQLGHMAEAVIDEGFATRGYGKWAPNKPATIRRKKSDMPLIDKGKLRRSITSRVVIKGKAKETTTK